MKRIFNRFITMLILMVIGLNIILPMSVYAVDNTVEDGEGFTVDESGWYQKTITYTSTR